MPDASLSEIKVAKSGNIRKILDAVVCVAPMSAAVPDTFTVNGVLQSLAAVYGTPRSPRILH